MSGELEVVSNNELLEKMKTNNPMVLKEDSDDESEQEDNQTDDVDDVDDDVDDDDDDDDEATEGEQNDDEELNSSVNKKEKADITTKKVTNINDTTILKSDKLLNDSDSDSDSEDLDNKFSNYDKNNFISVNHPELLNHNYEEIDSLSTITKDDAGIIVDPLHTTLPFLTKYEKTRILGYRTKQLNNGSKPYVEVKNNILDNYEIALMELNEKKIPYIVKRPMPSGGCEYWKLIDLEIIN